MRKRMPPVGRLKPLALTSMFWAGTSDEFWEGGKIPGVTDIADVPDFDDEPSEEEGATRRIFTQMGSNPGDWGVAERVAKYNLPNATVPELVVMDYLDQGNRVYLYQQSIFGGRTEYGGLVPDFLVMTGQGWMVWNVQGEYWHSSRDKTERDRSLPQTYLKAYARGVPIVGYVELWENDIYNKRQLLFSLAESGRGLR